MSTAGKDVLPFKYVKSCNRTIVKQHTPTTFKWDGKSVASLAAQGSVYCLVEVNVIKNSLFKIISCKAMCPSAHSNLTYCSCLSYMIEDMYSCSY